MKVEIIFSRQPYIYLPRATLHFTIYHKTQTVNPNYLAKLDP